jgi:hypothetical protein
MFPLSTQLYVGVVPPFVGVATKVTFVPEQIVPTGLVDTVTDGTTLGFTVNTTLDVAVTGLAQVALLVIVQTTVFAPVGNAGFE